MHIDTAAVEVGFGYTKTAYRKPNREIKIGSFPSLAPIHQSSIISQSISHGPTRRIYTISVNNKQYDVGPDVSLSVGGGNHNHGRYLNDDFPNTDNYIALVLGALVEMGATEVDCLVLGLPVKTMKKYSELLKQTFTNVFNVNNVRIRIRHVKVIPQPVGTLIHYAAKNPQKISSNVTNLVIDPGYVTTDWVVATGYHIIDSRSDGNLTGISTILKNTARTIAADHDKKFDRIDRLDNALRTGTPLSIFNEVIANETLWAYARQNTPLIEECLGEIITSVGSMDDISNVILTGGGAKYYEFAAKRIFKNTPVIINDDSSNGNAIGFLFIGESTQAQHA